MKEDFPLFRSSSSNLLLSTIAVLYYKIDLFYTILLSPDSKQILAWVILLVYTYLVHEGGNKFHYTVIDQKALLPYFIRQR